jgi:hypothetical protein
MRIALISKQNCKIFLFFFLGQIKFGDLIPDCCGGDGNKKTHSLSGGNGFSEGL